MVSFPRNAVSLTGYNLCIVDVSQKTKMKDAEISDTLLRSDQVPAV